MSPKRMTNLALIVASISIIGIIGMPIIGPGWGIFSWWPAVGLSVFFLLILAALIKGASLAAERQADVVEALNDCYTDTFDSNLSQR
jgi:hypothetical protein